MCYFIAARPALVPPAPGRASCVTVWRVQTAPPHRHQPLQHLKVQPTIEETTDNPLGASAELWQPGSKLVMCTLDLFGKHKQSCSSLGRSAGATKPTSSCACLRIYVETSHWFRPNPSLSNAKLHRFSCNTDLIALYMHSKNSLMLSSPVADLARLA